MRIRKRFPPPAASSNSPADPQLQNSHLVQQHQQLVQQLHFPLAHPSDHPIHSQQNMDEFGEMKDINQTRKEGILCGETSSIEVKMPWTTSHDQVFGGWYGEDKAIPIKKRRGSLGKRAGEDSARKDDNDEKTIVNMKSKTNKKCVQENGDDDDELYEGAGLLQALSKGVNIDLNSSIVSDQDDQVKKNVKRGNVIMEGSRCSRVNGRGWRCCQQTLVGYSLCEHHLGKGRLRSMNNTRNRAKSKKGSNENIDRAKTSRVQQEKNKEIKSVDDHDSVEDVVDDYDEDDGVMKKQKKKKKIGMVKARSISSLLGLGQGEGEITADEDK